MDKKVPQSINRGYFAALGFGLCTCGLSLHAIVLVRNSEFLSTLGATCCQYSTTISCSHSLTETVLVFSLSVRGFKCSFHLFIYVLCYYSHEFGLQK